MLEHTQIDMLVRWHRMRGERTLWLPGMDHAGIATQFVVERMLATEGIKRQDLGREEFERRVWKWKAESGGVDQGADDPPGRLVRLDAREFTLEPALYRAVLEAFLRLYREGLIYRGRYMVNWCPRCQTAISDLEVVHNERPGNFWHIRYPVTGATKEFLVVATTRPETMLGDTAVAVIPRTSATRICRQAGDVAADGPRNSGDRGFVRRPRIRNRGGENHAGARPQRLRSRQAPPPAGNRRDDR